jgi:hypothetical protein
VKHMTLCELEAARDREFERVVRGEDGRWGWHVAYRHAVESVGLVRAASGSNQVKVWVMGSPITVTVESV